MSTRLSIGYQYIGRGSLEAAKKANRRLNMKIVGVLRIASSVTPSLADETIERIQLIGFIQGPEQVVELLEPRIERWLL